VQLEHQFTVPASPEVVWAAVVDPARVAPCMPGATLTEVNGSEFAGSVKVKLGPVSLLYKGSGQFVEIDEQSKRVVIKASGKDSRGNGTASATVTLTLRADGQQTHGSVLTDLAITGKPAQFGRGMIAEVGGKILDTFATCLAGKLGDASPDGAQAAQSQEPAKPAPRKRATSTAARATPAKAAPAKPPVRASAATPAPAAAEEQAAETPTPASAPASAAKAAPTPAKPAAKAAPVKPAAAKPATPAKPAAKPAAAAAKSATQPVVKAEVPVVTPAEDKPAAAKPAPVKQAADKPAPPKPASAKPSPAEVLAAAKATNGATASVGVRTTEESPAQQRIQVVAESETEPIDLLDYAGPSVLKRAIPLVAGIVVLLLVIRWLRRR
jgi:uncharacterized protein